MNIRKIRIPNAVLNSGQNCGPLFLVVIKKILKELGIGYVDTEDDTYIGNGWYKEILTLSVPEEDQVIAVTTRYRETVINFSGDISENFILTIDPTSTTQVGDKVFLIAKSSVGGIEITFGGAISAVLCGDVKPEFELDENFIKVLELVWDGTNYTGLDNC